MSNLDQPHTNTDEVRTTNRSESITKNSIDLSTIKDYRELERTVNESIVELDQSLSKFKKDERIERRKDILRSSFLTVKSLSDQVSIDPDLFFNPRGLKVSAELVENRTSNLKIIFSKLRLIRKIHEFCCKISENKDHEEEEEEAEEEEEESDEESDFWQLRCKLIYRLTCWYSTDSSCDEWVLDKSFKLFIKDFADQLWKSTVPSSKSLTSHPSLKISDDVEISRTILSNHIKPLFAQESGFSRNVNPNTGRRVQDNNNLNILFGPSSDDFENGQVWKTGGIGSWNCICFLLNRVQNRHEFEVLWPLIIPPMITLLEDSTIIYRIRGTQISLELLENVEPLLIHRTGINSLLQRSFSSSFSLMNADKSLELLRLTFKANLKLIKKSTQENLNHHEKSLRNEGERDLTAMKKKIEKMDRLNKLIEESVFNVLSFGKKTDNSNDSDGDEKDEDGYGIDDYVMDCLSELVKREFLGIFIARYLRVIIPYLIETILNFKFLKSLTYVKVFIKINRLLMVLFDLKNFETQNLKDFCNVEKKFKNRNNLGEDYEIDKDENKSCEEKNEIDLKAEKDGGREDYEGFDLLIDKWRGRLMIVILNFLVEFKSSLINFDSDSCGDDSHSPDKESKDNYDLNKNEPVEEKVKYDEKDVESLKKINLMKDSIKKILMVLLIPRKKYDPKENINLNTSSKNDKNDLIDPGNIEIKAVTHDQGGRNKSSDLIIIEQLFGMFKNHHIQTFKNCDKDESGYKTFVENLVDELLLF